MEVVHAVGFVSFWGFTPALDFIENKTGELHVLIAGSGDLRHLLRSIAEHVPEASLDLHVYICETAKEVLARDILLLHLINELELPIRERVELFLDLYGNALMRERTAEYLDLRVRPLIQVVTGTSRTSFAGMLDFSLLKHKDRDEIEEVMQAWRLAVPFDIGSLRDTRLRAHYKERYDHRVNLIDWDYQWHVKLLGPQIHFIHFKEWRNTGVAFEVRLARYTVANRTLSGYQEGRKKTTRDSCLVRGYWGDIVMSPYWAFGIDVYCCAQCNEILNRISSDQRVHVKPT
mmetsp:Transcript_10524/g.20225  ORF Transcript_10524/g.20225 Transcript_10524/m.20225 type:complete len:289 (-) Transcript_10524:11-877(-)